MAKKNAKRAAAVESKGYNGWKNYETWNVALWIDNDEPSYKHARMLARQAKGAAEQSAEEVKDSGRGIAREARGFLADELKMWIEEIMPEVTGMWADLMGAALSEVDWYEIAENILSEER